jgi:hypothetical protein
MPTEETTASNGILTLADFNNCAAPEGWHVIGRRAANGGDRPWGLMSDPSILIIDELSLGNRRS